MSRTPRVDFKIVARDTHARGALKDTVRPMIATAYGFTEASDEGARAANRARYVRLTDEGNGEPNPTFHYKVLVISPRTLPYMTLLYI